MPKQKRTPQRRGEPETVTIVVQVKRANPVYSFYVNPNRKTLGPCDFIENLSMEIKGRVLLPKGYEDEIRIHFLADDRLDKMLSEEEDSSEPSTCIGALYLRRSRIGTIQVQTLPMRGIEFMRSTLIGDQNTYLILDGLKERQKTFRVTGLRIERSIDIDDYA